VAVPDGWQLVPTKHEGKAGLTHEMCDAFWKRHSEASQKHGHYESTNAGYNALLAAAPKPSAPQAAQQDLPLMMLRARRDQVLHLAELAQDINAPANIIQWLRAEAGKLIEIPSAPAVEQGGPSAWMSAAAEDIDILYSRTVRKNTDLDSGFLSGLAWSDVAEIIARHAPRQEAGNAEPISRNSGADR
jgi:hypothetical protein